MKTQIRTIIPIDVPVIPPVQVAAAAYIKWKSDVPFIQDLAHYLEEGIVIARPDIFGMAKIVDVRPLDAQGNPIGDKPEPGWFVRIAVGPLDRLLRALPGHLPKIRFCRRNDPRLREYSLDRMLKLAGNKFGDGLPSGRNRENNGRREGAPSPTKD